LTIVAKNIITSEQSGKFLDESVRQTVQLKTAVIGLGTYQPGWKWSLHAGVQTGKLSENHIGYIVSGHMIVRDSDGVEVEIGPGDGFEVMPGHDAWVIGNEPCVALDFAILQITNNKNG
jgi:uncharacterized cupin superfamily protein